MKITERRLRSIIRSVIKEDHPLDGTMPVPVETDIDKVPADQYFKWQEGKYDEVMPMYRKVLSDFFQARGY